MTREQKFEARLVETGLMDEWNKIGRLGRVAKADENGDITLFIHEGESDNYSEIHYPSFNVLRMNYSFVKGCILEWRGTGGDFEKQLDDWLAYGMCSSTGCPLAPVDVYFPASGLHTYYQDFEDDEHKTLADILEDYYTGEPYEVAKGHLREFLEDLDEARAFVGGVYEPDEIMKNLESPR